MGDTYKSKIVSDETVYTRENQFGRRNLFPTIVLFLVQFCWDRTFAHQKRRNWDLYIHLDLAMANEKIYGL